MGCSKSKYAFENIDHEYREQQTLEICIDDRWQTAEIKRSHHKLYVDESSTLVLTMKDYHRLVHGYVRESSVSSKLEIPMDLIEIVHLFFPKPDTWERILSHSALSISADGNGVHARITSEWQNAYGTHTIKPIHYIRKGFEKDKNIFKVWRIRLDMLPFKKTVFLGIIPECKIASVRAYFCCARLGYGLSGSNNETYHTVHGGPDSIVDPWRKLSVVWREGQTMDIIMYFKKGDNEHCCLGYQTHAQIETAFDDLDINLTYRFAAAFWGGITSLLFV